MTLSRREIEPGSATDCVIPAARTAIHPALLTYPAFRYAYSPHARPAIARQKKVVSNPFPRPKLEPCIQGTPFPCAAQK